VSEVHNESGVMSKKATSEQSLVPDLWDAGARYLNLSVVRTVACSMNGIATERAAMPKLHLPLTLKLMHSSLLELALTNQPPIHSVMIGLSGLLGWDVKLCIFLHNMSDGATMDDALLKPSHLDQQELSHG